MMAQEQNKILFGLWLTLQSIYLNKEIKNFDFAKSLGFDHYRGMISEVSNTGENHGVYGFAQDLANTENKGSVTAKLFCLSYQENFTSENISDVLTLSDKASGEILDEHLRVIYEIYTSEKLNGFCSKDEKLIISNIFSFYLHF